MFGNVPRAMWEKWIRPDEQSRIALACRAMLIETDGKRVLCETGIGAFFEPKLAERFGVVESEHVLLKSLASAGLKQDDIDCVILSHLHFDHAGGLLPSWENGGAAGDLLFPRARYVVGREAWNRALKPHSRDRASFIPGLTEKMRDSGRLVIVDGDGPIPELGARFRFMVSNGHTPGQLHTIFRGDNATVFFAGDLVPGRAWVHLPVTMGYDRYPELVIDEKQKLYDEVLAGRWWLFYTHDTDVAMSRLSRAEPSGRFEPVDAVNMPQRMPL
jgi:glyoxylase-like metal-dependent hydrolase (beta-lactamase superfamily II)